MKYSEKDIAKWNKMCLNGATKRHISKIMNVPYFQVKRRLCEINKNERKPTSHADFLSSFTVSNDGCWNWDKPLTHQYGYFRNKGKVWLAHRYSYQYYNGDPGNFLVCHTCDNPKCVNPSHLFLGTHYDNNIDKAKKLRIKKYAVTPKMVLSIKKMIANGVSPKKIKSAFNVSEPMISDIKLGKTWRWLNSESDIINK